MNEKKVVQPVEKVDEKPKVENKDIEMYGKLRNEILKAKENYTISLQQTKDVIEQRTQELDVLKMRKLKLEGAIESCEILLKSALPPNK